MAVKVPAPTSDFLATFCFCGALLGSFPVVSEGKASLKQVGAMWCGPSTQGPEH